jgi:hypothetical protein
MCMVAGTASCELCQVIRSLTGRHASLRFWFSIGPDEQDGEEAREGAHLVSTGDGDETVHFVYLREEQCHTLTLPWSFPSSTCYHPGQLKI